MPILEQFHQFLHKNAISETALPITETKKRKHFAIEGTPQNLGKLRIRTNRYISSHVLKTWKEKHEKQYLFLNVCNEIQDFAFK